jgi:hypothetical protein
MVINHKYGVSRVKWLVRHWKKLASIRERGRDFSICHRVQTSFWAQLAFYPMRVEGSYPEAKLPETEADIRWNLAAGLRLRGVQ